MNILILSASTGGGHMKASEALRDYIVENEVDAKVKLVDTIEYISPTINKVVTDGYVMLVRNMNYLYRIFYKDTDRNSLVSRFVTRILLTLSKSLLPLIEEFEADVIITAHPFSTEIISILKGSSRIGIPLICIMTDYAAHNTWIKKNVDEYCVATKDMIDEMVKRGVKREKIHPFGIPVSQKFFCGDMNDKRKLLNSLNLKDITTILIMAGSFGVNNIENIYKELIEVNGRFQIIVLTGNNDKLYNKMKKNMNTSTKETRVIKFTNDVHRYMNLADILITKPGGLTISEALASNLPMIIFDAIPGQEEANSQFLLNHGMAVSIGSGTDCKEVLEDLINDNKKLKKLTKNCGEFNKEACSEQILELIRISIIKKKDKTFKVI